MNGTTISLGFLNNQTDMDWFFMNKFVLGTSYILIEKRLHKWFKLLQCFLLQISDPLS